MLIRFFDTYACCPLVSGLAALGCLLTSAVTPGCSDHLVTWRTIEKYKMHLISIDLLYDNMNLKSSIAEAE